MNKFGTAESSEIFEGVAINISKSGWLVAEN
jgi:hypothetical protein